MNPIVSIIIPVYNKADYIQNTLGSALGQSFPNTEIILVDDGSTDCSLEILKAYFKKYPDKITLIDQENRGVSSATNTGLCAAKGEYIQFLDADDLMSTDKIENQIMLLKDKPSSFMASCEWVMFQDNPSNFTNIPYGVFQEFDSGLDLLLRFWNHQEMMAISSYLIHRSLIEKAGPWDESLTINQDGEFFARALIHAGKVLFEPKSKVFYRKPSATNVSQQKSEKAMSSQLESIKSYERHVLQVQNTKNMRIALMKVYQKFIYDVYPNYPELIKQAEKLQLSLGISKRVFIGGPKFQLISKILGFKNAIKLKRALNI